MLVGDFPELVIAPIPHQNNPSEAINAPYSVHLAPSQLSSTIDILIHQSIHNGISARHQAPLAVAHTNNLPKLDRQSCCRRHDSKTSARGFSSTQARTYVTCYCASCNHQFLAHQSALNLSPLSPLPPSAPAAQSCPPTVSTPLRHSVSSSPVGHRTRKRAVCDRLRSSRRMSCRIVGCICFCRLLGGGLGSGVGWECRGDLYGFRGKLYGIETYTLNWMVRFR